MPEETNTPDPYADLRLPGKVCEHGTLARNCNECWQAREIELLKACVRRLAGLGTGTPDLSPEAIEQAMGLVGNERTRT